MKLLIILSTLLLTLIHCQSADSIKPVHGQGLPGTWLLYETGYSPGAGYVVNKVPSQPAQTLTFTADGQMQAQGERLRGYQTFSTFRIDTVRTVAQIHYFPTSDSSSTYERINLSGDTLTLSSPFCIEGCHSAFLRIK